MTLTEEPTNTRQFTSTDVCEMTGLSFRVLDYWLRTGAIKITDGATPGSGVMRTYTPAEVEAIRCLVERYSRANAEIEAIRSGKAWLALTADKPGRRR